MGSIKDALNKKFGVKGKTIVDALNKKNGTKEMTIAKAIDAMEVESTEEEIEGEGTT